MGDQSKAEFVGLEKVETPWYISTDGDEVAFVWGHGLRNVTLPSVGTKVSSALATHTCSLLVSSVHLTAGNLQGSTMTTCTPNVSKSTSAIFQRRNAIAIWVDYSSWGHSGMALSNPMVMTWAVPCRGTSGPWMYAIQAGAYADGMGSSALYRGAVDLQYLCGT